MITGRLQGSLCLHLVCVHLGAQAEDVALKGGAQEDVLILGLRRLLERLQLIGRLAEDSGGLKYKV